MGQKVIGYVYKKRVGGKYVAMMEADDRVAAQVGEASSETEAMNLIIAAYLRT